MNDTYTALVAEVEAAAGQAAERGAATLTKETLLAIRAAITTLQSQLAEARDKIKQLGLLVYEPRDTP